MESDVPKKIVRLSVLSYCSIVISMVFVVLWLAKVQLFSSSSGYYEYFLGALFRLLFWALALVLCIIVLVMYKRYKKENIPDKKLKIMNWVNIVILVLLLIPVALYVLFFLILIYHGIIGKEVIPI